MGAGGDDTTCGAARLRGADAGWLATHAATATATARMDFLKTFVAQNRVAVLSKSYCPYCARAKQAITGTGASFTAVELDLRDDGAGIQEAALELTGQRTVPNVWVNGTHVGGSDRVVATIQSGEFQRLLNRAKS